MYNLQLAKDFASRNLINDSKCPWGNATMPQGKQTARTNQQELPTSRSEPCVTDNTERQFHPLIYSYQKIRNRHPVKIPFAPHNFSFKLNAPICSKLEPEGTGACDQVGCGVEKWCVQSIDCIPLVVWDGVFAIASFKPTLTIVIFSTLNTTAVYRNIASSNICTRLHSAGIRLDCLVLLMGTVIRFSLQNCSNCIVHHQINPVKYQVSGYLPITRKPRENNYRNLETSVDVLT